MPKGETAKSSVIFLRGRRYSSIAAISFDGVLCHRTVVGSMDSQIFNDFLVQDVVRGAWRERLRGMPVQAAAAAAVCLSRLG